jgi:hypothetical protein
MAEHDLLLERRGELGGNGRTLEGELPAHDDCGAPNVRLYGADRLAKGLRDFTVSTPLEELQTRGGA